MKKHKILLILVVAAIAVALVPLTVSAASPKLNLTKVTLPKNSPNGNGHMYLWVKGTSKKVKWSTSNKKIVSIEKTGTKNCISITANKKGKATITAKVGNKKLKCKVTVTKAMSSKALKKYIKVDTSTIDRQYMTYTNTSKKYYLGVHSTFHLYDDQGSSVDWNTPSAKLAPGKSVKIWVYNPHKYTNSKVDLENVWIDYEYHPIKATAEVQPVTPENILPVVVTNKSLYNESLYYVTVFFKKEGEIIWALQSDTDKDHPGEGMKPGDSRTVEFWLNEFVPTDYDEIKVQIGRSSGY